MRKERKSLSKQNGFEVTTVNEFLDLSPYEEAVIEIRLALSQELKKRRLEANKSQVTFAKELNTSQSRLAKMEAGEKSVSLDLLIKGLLKAGISRGELSKLFL